MSIVILILQGLRVRIGKYNQHVQSHLVSEQKWPDVHLSLHDSVDILRYFILFFVCLFF